MPDGLFDRPALAPKRARLLELLRTRAYAKREVILSSGAKSDFYIDCKQVTLDAEGAVLCGELIHAVIEHVAPRAMAVGGLTMGADPLATASSIASFRAGQPRPAFLVRKEPKGHGTNQWVESPAIPQGSPVAIVEDVVTTGASTLKAIERVRLAGFEVACAIALVDRSEGGSGTVSRVLGEAPLVTLFMRRDFL